MIWDKNEQKINFWRLVLNLERLGISEDIEGLAKESLKIENLLIEYADRSKECTNFLSEGFRDTVKRAQSRINSLKLREALKNNRKIYKDSSDKQKIDKSIINSNFTDDKAQNSPFSYLLKFEPLEKKLFCIESQGKGRRAKSREEMLIACQSLISSVNLSLNNRHFIVSLSNSIYFFFSKWVQSIKYSHTEQRIPDLSLFLSVSSAFIDNRQETNLISSQKLAIMDLQIENNMNEIKYLKIMSYKLIKHSIKQAFLKDLQNILTKKYFSLKSDELIQLLSQKEDSLLEFPFLVDPLGLSVPEPYIQNFQIFYNRCFLILLQKFSDKLGHYLRKCVAIALNTYLMVRKFPFFNFFLTIFFKKILNLY